MMDKVNSGTTQVEVEKYTRLGSQELQAGHVNKAVEYFDSAYKHAVKLGESVLVRVCAFNLGAVYVASRNPQQGLPFLNQAIPPTDTNDGHSNGDLFYNFGLAYELQGSKYEAVKYFELALEEYQKDKSNVSMEGEVSHKVGMLYVSLGSPHQAVRAFSVASSAYGGLSDLVHQAGSLAQQASSLYRAQKAEEALRVADDCIMICQRIAETEALGKLYNELGLIYTQCSDFGRAQTCFELALPLSRGPRGDKRQQAVILQNLGAVYNSLGDYQRSMAFHEAAAALHAELHNRNAQGQCFTNLAFAHSRLGDTDSAGECYLHALQATRDSGDKHGEWQAMEGLGAVCFHAGNVSRAVHYYQQALSTLAASGENNHVAQERLVGKLRDSLRHQLSEVDYGTMNSKQVPIMVNDLPRPPTRQEMRDIERLREERVQRIHEVRKNPSEFERIALGLGEYDTDSDMSLRKDEARFRKGRARGRNHPRSQSEPRAGRSRDEVDQEIQPQTAKPLGAEKKPPVKRLSRRHSSKGGPMPPGRRQAYLDSLLKPEGYDSEEEWKKRVQDRKGKIGSGDRYRSKLRPMSPADSSEEDTRGRQHHRERRHSASDLEEKLRRHLEEERARMRNDLRSISVDRKPRRHRAETETEQDTAVEDGVHTPPQVLPIHSSRPQSAARSRKSDTRPSSSSTAFSSARSRPGSSARSRPGSSVRSDPRPGSRSPDALNDTAANLTQYQEQLQLREEAGEEDTTLTEGTTESITEVESESDTQNDTENDMEDHFRETTGPPPFTAPIPPDGQKPLHDTYERPDDAVPSTSSTHKNPGRRGSRNYFHTEGEGHAPGGEGHAPGVVTQVFMRSTSNPTVTSENHASKSSLLRSPTVEISEGDNTLKFTTTDSLDPTYQTIRSLGGSRPLARQEGTDQPEDLPPDLPPRPEGQLDRLSRAQQEEYLRNYHRSQAEKHHDEDVPLPHRANKATSKACVVM